MFKPKLLLCGQNAVKDLWGSEASALEELRLAVA